MMLLTTRLRLDPDGTLATIDSGYTIPNGFAWSPDDRTLYLADSHVRTIFAYDFHPATGEARNRRLFAQTAEGTMPDGAMHDPHGSLCAHHGDLCARPGDA